MSKLLLAALSVASGGLITALIELLLPRSDIRRTAKAAIGLIFLELLAIRIADIFR